MFIDTHSHLYLGELQNHIPEAIQHLKDAKFSHAIQIGTSIETSRTCIDLAEGYDVVLTTVGIHPCEAQDISVEEISTQIAELEKMILENIHPGKVTRLGGESIARTRGGGAQGEGKMGGLVVGLGEIGFDHYHLSKNPEEAELQKSRQVEWFHAQADLAIKHNLPVVIHTRNCSPLTLMELKKSGLKKFVIHCFSEDMDFAQEVFAISPETKISFTGILTYPKSLQIQEVAKSVPLNRIMIETDAPYLIPESFKGKTKFCEPVYSLEVFKKLCELRSETPEEIEEALWNNSCDFFNLQ